MSPPQQPDMMKYAPQPFTRDALLKKPAEVRQVDKRYPFLESLADYEFRVKGEEKILKVQDIAAKLGISEDALDVGFGLYKFVKDVNDSLTKSEFPIFDNGKVRVVMKAPTTLRAYTHPLEGERIVNFEASLYPPK